jgi:hypothetical protein
MFFYSKALKSDTFIPEGQYFEGDCEDSTVWVVSRYGPYPRNYYSYHTAPAS